MFQRYTPYFAAVIGYVAGTYAKQPDLEELVSDVFLALWRGAKQVQAGKLRPWLDALARNKAWDYLRSLRAGLPLEDDVLSLEADLMQAGAEEDELRRTVREAVLFME